MTNLQKRLKLANEAKELYEKLYSKRQSYTVRSNL